MISLVSMTVWKQLANLLEKDMDSHDIWKNAYKCNIIEFLETYWKDFSVVPFKVNSHVLIGSSSYWLPNDSYYVSLEKLVSDQLVIS